MTGGANEAQEDPAMLRFVYGSPDGNAVTVTLSMDDNAGPGLGSCFVYGVVTGG